MVHIDTFHNIWSNAYSYSAIYGVLVLLNNDPWYLAEDLGFAYSRVVTWLLTFLFYQFTIVEISKIKFWPRGTVPNLCSVQALLPQYWHLQAAWLGELWPANLISLRCTMNCPLCVACVLAYCISLPVLSRIRVCLNPIACWKWYPMKSLPWS